MNISVLTEKQEVVLNFIRQFQRDAQVPPSTRIIKSGLGFKSQNSAVQYLATLARKGCVEKYADGRWGVKQTLLLAHILELPVLGEIPAGPPSSHEQADGERVAIDVRMFAIKSRQLERFFALRVTGDSMIEANIVSGDLVICEWCEPQIGDIVAALVDETTVTLKRLVRENRRLLLRPANPRNDDIKSDQFEAQGVVRGVIRRSVVLAA